MLAAVHVRERLAGILAVAGLDVLVHAVKLRALEAVEQDAAERLVEVLLDAGDDFFEDIGIGGTGPPGCTLGGVVLVEKLGDGCLGGHRHELLLFGHLFPVVDEDGFEGVGNEEPDGWSSDEFVFLQRA